MIPEDAFKAAWDVIVNDLLLTTWLAICFVIIKLEFEVSTVAIFSLGNLVDIDELTSLNLGALIVNGDDVEKPDIFDPSQIPATSVVEFSVIVFPSAETADILLKCGSEPAPLL